MLDGNHSPLFGMPLRMPPSNVEAEKALLGALLANNKALERCTFLQPEHFADPVNGFIFREVRKLVDVGRLADTVTLNTHLEHTGALEEVGGTTYLVGLLASMVGIINAGDYAKVVRDTWLRRQIIDAGEILVNDAFALGTDIDPNTLIATAIEQMDRIFVRQNTRQSLSTLDTAMAAAMEAHDAAARRKGPAGVSTGFHKIDLRLGGLEPGLVYVLAGRPGSGKSALGHTMALNAARAGEPVHEISLEMSAKQLGARTLSAASRVPLIVLKNGWANNDQAARLIQAERELKGLPITIDDGGGLTAAQIVGRVKARRRKGKLGLVMIDHLNLMRVDEVNARQGATWAVEQASGMILALAKEADVPVILLAQLNRDVEKRDNHRPQLSDLRQAGAIEQDAYAVGFVYRPEYYLQTEPEQGEKESGEKFNLRLIEWEDRKRAAAGKAEVIWAKVRDGETGSDMLTFHGPTTSFAESDQHE